MQSIKSIFEWTDESIKRTAAEGNYAILRVYSGNPPESPNDEPPRETLISTCLVKVGEK